MAFRQNLEEILNSGDPEVRTWFLVRQNYLPFILCGLYVLFSTAIGPAIMRNRKPLSLRRPMIFYNFFIVAVYTFVITMTMLNLPSVSRRDFCKGTRVKKGTIVYTLIRCGWIVYLLKYLEFLDTVFFILRKKERSVTFLHVVHHTLVPILGWILLRTERGGMQCIPVLVNSIIHIIMYSYYGLAAIGPHMNKYLWWKEYLTIMQMGQFIFIIAFVLFLAPLTGCTIVKSSILMDIILAPFFLGLFYNFYLHAFKKKTVKSL